MKFAIIIFPFIFLASTSAGQIQAKKIIIKQKDLGMTIREAIKKYKIDTSRSWKLDEPPGVARGIATNMPDSTVIFLQIERKEFNSSLDYEIKDLLNEKVIGIGVAYANCKNKIIGTGFVWWGVSNPHFKTLNIDRFKKSYFSSNIQNRFMSLQIQEHYDPAKFEIAWRKKD